MQGSIIKEIRKKKGLTQKEVCSGVVSKSFYSDFEAGKHDITVTKFVGLLNNLNISYQEFENFQQGTAANKVDELYKKGQFEALYQFYLENSDSPRKEIRYDAIHAYLLVLLTHTNFYRFSRDPFGEITAELENAKMWTLKEIKLAKLVLLSLTEGDKTDAEKMFHRIKQELIKYLMLDSKTYYQESADLYFNRLQSLLILNDLTSAKEILQDYQTMLRESDDLYLFLQLKFITNLVNLYFDFPNYQKKIEQFMLMMREIPTSETHFYQIILDLHLEKARNFYQRQQKLS